MKEIKISKNGCRPCTSLQLAIESEREEFEKRGIQITDVNISEEPEAIDLYNINSVPTVILEKDTKEVWRSIGFTPVERILEVIDEKL